MKCQSQTKQTYGEKPMNEKKNENGEKNENDRKKTIHIERTGTTTTTTTEDLNVDKKIFFFHFRLDFPFFYIYDNCVIRW